MSKTLVKRILNHPDRDELISRLVAGDKLSEVSVWLKTKYSEGQFAIGEAALKTFRDDHLDMYLHMKEDILAAKSETPEDKLSKRITSNKRYKDKINDLAATEIDVKRTVINLVAMIEDRMAQVFDHLQDYPGDFKVDAYLIQYFNTLGAAVDRCNKIVNEGPDQIIQHNHSIEVSNQQMAILVEAVKETIKSFDYEKSLMFMELFNEKIAALTAPEEFKPQAGEVRLAEAKLLTEKIIEKDTGLPGM